MASLIRSVDKLPQWFDLANYQSAKDLDVCGWFWQFNTRAIDYYLPRLRNPEKEPQNFTSVIPVPSRCADKLTTSPDPPTGTPIVFSVDKGYSFSGYLPRGLEAGLFERVTVDLSAPDELILDHFKKWLSARRQRSAPGSRRRRVFTKTELKYWWLDGLLPYIDLKYWAELKGHRITFPVYGEALFPGWSKGDRAERVRKTTAPKARKMIKDFRNINLLALQAKAEKKDQ